MFKKSPVSFPQNIWFDSEQVDDSDLNLEQSFVTNSHASLIDNHVGTGVLPESLDQAILFDSEQYIQNAIRNGAATPNTLVLDGIKIEPSAQPTDQNYGNQLEVELSNSLAAGKRKVKIAIIGLDFDGNLQFDTFYFSKNERQYTKKHYTNILAILLNDFIAPPSLSMSLGGRLVIREAPPLKISRDPIMVAQNIEPNLFFRDFFTTSAPPTTIQSLLITSLPFFNIDTLGIYTGYKDNKVLAKGDTVTQIGQKFLATTNNIQKIRLLLSVKNSDFLASSNLRWGGDLIVSIYELQSSVASPLDISPDYPIDFSPANRPIAQLTYTYDSLKDVGFILDETPQPIDFVFSNTVVASGSAITPGKYYAVTVKRAGADACDIMLTCGSNRISNSKVTVFSESDWYDLPEDNLWFEIYTDSIKVTDGQAYDAGHGVILDKVKKNDITGQIEDYCEENIQFVGSQKYSAVLQSNTESMDLVQDQRTGNPVFSRKQSKPEIKLLSSLELNGLLKTSTPFVIGSVVDDNQKYTSLSPISAKIKRWTYLKNKIILKADSSTSDLRFAINNGSIVGAKITPNVTVPNRVYRVARADIQTMKYGDINGDGVVDDKDIREFYQFGYLDLTSSPPLTSTISYDSDGYLSYRNGYQTFTKPFKIDSSISFDIVDPTTKQKVASFQTGGSTSSSPSGSISNPNGSTFSAVLDSEAMAQHFGDVDSATGRPLVSGKLVVIKSSSYPENIGVFTVNEAQPTTRIPGSSPPRYSLNIQKLYYDQDLIMKFLRADINEDFVVSAQDKHYADIYVSRMSPERAFLEAFPFDQQYYNNVGKDFDVIVLTLENDVYNSDATGATSTSSIERTDDYFSNISNRGTRLHGITDICVNDPALIGKSFKSQVYTNTNLTTVRDSNTVSAAGIDFTSIIPGGILPGDTIRIIKEDATNHMDITRTISLVGPGNSLKLNGVAPINANNCQYYIYRDSTITMSILKTLTWDESLVRAYGRARHVPSIINKQSGAPTTDPLTKESFDPGAVDFYVPNSLVIGDAGEIKRPNGNFYKVDFEVGTITIEIPDGFATLGPDGYSTKDQSIKVFENFVAEDNYNSGLTSRGFRAMRFADGTVVKADALAKNQIRFSVSVQSFSPNTDGEDADGYKGVIVDGRMGVAMDYATGILTLNFANLKQHSTLQTVSTKIQISVFLKKGGFNNMPLLVDSGQTQNMLNLAGLFTAAGVPRPGINAPTIINDLAGPTITGILPISKGGTGLSSVGPAGHILSSDGAGHLVFDRKNPFSTIAFCGVATASSTTPATIGAFRFRPDSISTLGLSSLKIEAILETSDPANPAQLRLFSVTDNKYLDLDLSTPSAPKKYIEVSSQNATLVSSSDISAIILNNTSISLNSEYVYEVQLSFKNAPSATSDFAVCKMAGLFASYSGTALPTPTPSNPNRDALIVNTVHVNTSYNMRPSDTFVSVDRISSTITITLPTSPSPGQQVFIKDPFKSTLNFPIWVSGSIIDGSTNNIKVSAPTYSLTLIYDGMQWCSI